MNIRDIGHFKPSPRRDWSFREELRTRPAHKMRKPRLTMEDKIRRLQRLLAQIDSGN